MDTREARPVGRPTTYRPEHCETVIALGKEGKSRAEIASALDCSRQTLANWEAEHPEFLDALKRAKDEELAWWEAKGRTGIDQGSGFNAGLWGKCVSGRFPTEPYRERVQLTGANDGPVQIVDLSKLSEEELDAYERLCLRLGAVPAGRAGADQGGEGETGD